MWTNATICIYYSHDHDYGYINCVKCTFDAICWSQFSLWRRVEKLMENNLTRRKILGKQISHFSSWGCKKDTIDNNSSAIKNLLKIPITIQIWICITNLKWWKVNPNRWCLYSGLFYNKCHNEYAIYWHVKGVVTTFGISEFNISYF